MKSLITIAVVLFLLALTQAEDGQAVSGSSTTAVLETTELPLSDESRPSRPVRPEKPPRPGRPARRSFPLRSPRLQPNADQQADNENSLSRTYPVRQPVFFDIKFDLGQGNQIQD